MGDRAHVYLDRTEIVVREEDPTQELAVLEPRDTLVMAPDKLHIRQGLKRSDSLWMIEADHLEGPTRKYLTSPRQRSTRKGNIAIEVVCRGGGNSNMRKSDEVLESYSGSR